MVGKRRRRHRLSYFVQGEGGGYSDNRGTLWTPGCGKPWQNFCWVHRLRTALGVAGRILARTGRPVAITKAREVKRGRQTVWEMTILKL